MEGKRICPAGPNKVNQSEDQRTGGPPRLLPPPGSQQNTVARRNSQKKFRRRLKVCPYEEKDIAPWKETKKAEGTIERKMDFDSSRSSWRMKSGF